MGDFLVAPSSFSKKRLCLDGLVAAKSRETEPRATAPAGWKTRSTMFAAESQDLNFGIQDRKDSWQSNYL